MEREREKGGGRDRERETLIEEGGVGERRRGGKNKPPNKNMQENGPLAENVQDRKSNRTRKERRQESGFKSNDSPEIPDRGNTSDTPGGLRGVYSVEKELKIRKIKTHSVQLINESVNKPVDI